MKLTIKCDWCGKDVERDESKTRGKKHLFCSRECLAAFSNKSKNPEGYLKLKDYTSMSKQLSVLNYALNPTRMTQETRAKIRAARLNSGEGKSYTKQYGRHEHRIVAEQLLGRELLPGETVHHIDGDKRNNDPSNILILESQSEHAKLHMRERKFWNGGDAR